MSETDDKEVQDDGAAGAAADAAANDDSRDEAELWDEMERSERAAASGDDDDSSSGDKADDEELDGAQAAAGDDADRDSDDSAKSGDDKSADAQQSDDNSSDNADGVDQEDPWASAPPELRSAFQAERDKWESRDKRVRGQVSALQRQLNEAMQAIEQPSRKDGAADDGKQGDRSKALQRAGEYLESEDWKAFAAEYPEVAKPLKPLTDIIDALQSQVGQFDKTVGAIAQEREADAVNEQLTLLAEQHSDWEEVVEDPALGEWLQSQPRHIREAAVRNAETIVDAEEAGDVLTRFKQFRDANGNGGNHGANGSASNGAANKSTQGRSARKQRQLQSARTTRQGSPSGAMAGIPEDADEETIWKAMDAEERRARRA